MIILHARVPLTKESIDALEEEYKHKTLQDVVIIRNEFDVVAIQSDTDIHVLGNANG